MPQAWNNSRALLAGQSLCVVKKNSKCMSLHNNSLYAVNSFVTSMLNSGKGKEGKLWQAASYPHAKLQKIRISESDEMWQLLVLHAVLPWFDSAASWLQFPAHAPDGSGQRLPPLRGGTWIVFLQPAWDLVWVLTLKRSLVIELVMRLYFFHCQCLKQKWRQFIVFK